MIGKILNERQKIFIKKILYLGRNKYCNVCDSNIRNFIKGGIETEVSKKYKIIGGGVFENDICPVCKTSYRQRLLEHYFLKNDLYNKQSTVLHIAPEKNIAQKLTKNIKINYIAGDFNPENYSFPEKILKLDITSLPFDNELFDFVICNHVLEHVPEDLLAMSEIFRVLKKNGFGILQVPLSNVIENTLEDKNIILPEERLSNYGQFDHVRLYQFNDYVNRLKSVGFEVKIFDPKVEEPSNYKYLYEKLCLNQEEKIIIAYK